VHVAPGVSEERGREESGHTARARGLLPHRRSEDERTDGLHPTPRKRGQHGEAGGRQYPVITLSTFERSRVPGAVAAAPSTWDFIADRLFRALAKAAAGGLLLLLGFILIQIGAKAWPAIRQYGMGFLTSTTWDVGRGHFGIFPAIWGTLYSSVLALLIGGFFGVAMAIFLTQDFLPPPLAQVFRITVELLAAIPSVVYGLWGIFVVVPAVRPAANWLHDHVGVIPMFGTTLSGPGLLPAALVLAIMVLPTVAAVSQDALQLV